MSALPLLLLLLLDGVHGRLAVEARLSSAAATPQQRHRRSALLLAGQRLRGGADGAAGAAVAAEATPRPRKAKLQEEDDSSPLISNLQDAMEKKAQAEALLATKTKKQKPDPAIDGGRNYR